MINNSVKTSWQFVARFLLYQPPQEAQPFVLEEGPDDHQSSSAPVPDPLASSRQDLEALLRYARRLSALITQGRLLLRQQRLSGPEAAVLKAEYQSLTRQFAELAPIPLSCQNAAEPASRQLVSASLDENRRIIETLYSLPLNRDIVIREFTLSAAVPVRGMAVFTDGMVNTTVLNLAVLQPLMRPGLSSWRPADGDLLAMITRERLPSNQVATAEDFARVQEGINSGDTALFFDSISQAILANTKGWEHRGVEKPTTEPSVRGAMAGFSENLRTNTALIRTLLRSSDLVTEMLTVGANSRTTVALLYMKSVASPPLVAEVKRRINGIRTHFVDSSGTLLQFIEDTPALPFPQSLSTERPDRVSVHLAEGRLALVVDGNPYVHVLPVSFFTFFHSSEDFSLHLLVANFMRMLRLFGALLSTVLPSLYIAINYYHQEALPTELLLAIAGSRENVPFPAWFEVLVMEISFELIREAGVRIPGILGTTIGIVGAIILGQAAVSAHIVSPVVVVIIAITGLASFTIPEYRMSAAFRLLRFLLLIISASLGLVGLATGLLWLLAVLCSMKSIGLPYLSPMAPKARAGDDAILRSPVYDQEQRPDALNTQDRRRQPDVSRPWRQQTPAEEEEER